VLALVAMHIVVFTNVQDLKLVVMPWHWFTVREGFHIERLYDARYAMLIYVKDQYFCVRGLPDVFLSVLGLEEHSFTVFEHILGFVQIVELMSYGCLVPADFEVVTSYRGVHPRFAQPVDVLLPRDLISYHTRDAGVQIGWVDHDQFLHVGHNMACMAEFDTRYDISVSEDENEDSFIVVPHSVFRFRAVGRSTDGQRMCMQVWTRDSSVIVRDIQ